jgi:hypothetical protein
MSSNILKIGDDMRLDELNKLTIKKLLSEEDAEGTEDTDDGGIEQEVEKKRQENPQSQLDDNVSFPSTPVGLAFKQIASGRGDGTASSLAEMSGFSASHLYHLALPSSHPDYKVPSFATAKYFNVEYSVPYGTFADQVDISGIGKKGKKTKKEEPKEDEE